MDQSNQDIEANLLAENSNQNPALASVSPATQTSALTIRHQISVDIHKRWEFSPLANFVLLLIHIGKITASLYVIFSEEFPCIGERETWIYAMLGFDLLYVWVILARILHVRNVKIRNRSQANRIHDGNEINSQDGGLEADNGYLITQSFVRETYTLFRNHMILWLLTKTCQIVWFSFFLWGQYLFFLTFESECDTPGVVTLMKSFLILGYVWIFGPVFILALFFLVLVIFFAVTGRRPGLAPVPNAAIDRLAVTEFNHNLPGNKECIICMVDYQPGDKIVELRCNPMHFFHEDCAKKWLRINGVCPVCRVKVTKNSRNHRH